MEKGAIFPLFYHPTIEYFVKLIEHRDSIIFEKFEHFPKQTYRNRAPIHSPNGKLDLIIPVIKGANLHTSVKDVRISYEFNWQRQHLLSLQTSYRSSAYFEFYEPDLLPFYKKRWKFLYDFNEEILQFHFNALKLKVPYRFTTEYYEDKGTFLDFRHTIHPKLTPSVKFDKYYQVFEDKNGFLENMSVLDLLFNQGPQSMKYLI